MKNLLKIIVPVALICVGTNLNAQEMKMSPDERKENKQEQFEKMKAELNLTEDQAAKVKAIMVERREEMKENRVSKEEMMEMSAEQKKAMKVEKMQERKEMKAEVDTELKEILSEEQMQKYEAMMAERKEMKKEKKMMKSDHIHKPGEKHSHE